MLLYFKHEKVLFYFKHEEMTVCCQAGDNIGEHCCVCQAGEKNDCLLPSRGGNAYLLPSRRTYLFADKQEKMIVHCQAGENVCLLPSRRKCLFAPKQEKMVACGAKQKKSKVCCQAVENGCSLKSRSAYFLADKQENIVCCKAVENGRLCQGAENVCMFQRQ